MVDVYRPQHAVGEGGYKDSGITGQLVCVLIPYKGILLQDTLNIPLTLT